MWETITLGLVQGFTEFLPVSSSGHLVMAEHYLGMHSPGFSLEIALHLGTLCAVVLYYRKRIGSLINSIIRFSDPSLKQDRILVFLLILAMIPTGIIGLLLKGSMESFKSSLPFIGGSLVVTSLLLFIPQILSKRNHKNKDVTGIKSLLIGAMQGIAVIPGISRSGSTITTSLMLGVSPQKAAEFSFLLSIPAILAAFILEFDSTFIFTLDVLMGMLASFLSGLLAIKVFLNILGRGKLHWFGFYCLVIGSYLLYT